MIFSLKKGLLESVDKRNQPYDIASLQCHKNSHGQDWTGGVLAMCPIHCKPGQAEPDYFECGNSAEAMQVSQVNLFKIKSIIYREALICPIRHYRQTVG